jgi:hypothetical protein
MDSPKLPVISAKEEPWKSEAGNSVRVGCTYLDPKDGEAFASITVLYSPGIAGKEAYPIQGAKDKKKDVRDEPGIVPNEPTGEVLAVSYVEPGDDRKLGLIAAKSLGNDLVSVVLTVATNRVAVIRPKMPGVMSKVMSRIQP